MSGTSPRRFRASKIADLRQSCESVAAFERTLITRDRFDDFLKGQDVALTELERKGLHEFLSVGCTTCHNGPLIGGNGFRKIGILEPYPTPRTRGASR